MIRNGVEELPGFQRPVLQNSGRHVQIRPHPGFSRDKGFGSLEKGVPLAFIHRGVENPQPVPPGLKQARLGQDLEMPRHPRLPHFEQRHKLVHGKLVPPENMRQTKACFIRERFEITDGVRHGVGFPAG